MKDLFYHLSQGIIIFRNHHGLRTTDLDGGLFFFSNRLRVPLGPGQIDLDGGPFSGLAVDPDVTLALFHDPVYRGKSQTGAHPLFFGGEERIKYLAPNFLIHTDAVVCNGQHHVWPWLVLHPAIPEIGLIQLHVGRLDG